MSTENQKLQIDNACKAAEEFTKLYYYSFDMKRHKINKFYMNNATLSWDGNPATGKDDIQKFLEELPETVHNMIALDAQPVTYEGMKNEQIILVQAGGTIKFPSKKETKGFTQSFLITADDRKWRIVSDTCRLQVPIK
ncbi:UNVERIFIED_CONTAM: hypothetical protein PYX00_001392 [Menopon gallinae]|uniref:NTF2-related export protein n=1 Tax=Menopon gallinae TaxID=328185 RepID=A0AAW2IDV8_9NEOP